LSTRPDGVFDRLVLTAIQRGSTAADRGRRLTAADRAGPGLGAIVEVEHDSSEAAK
jgi:hypothetical protein